MRSRPTRKANAFIGWCLIFSRFKKHPSSTGTLARLLSAPMACRISWLKKDWNSPIESRFPLKRDQRISQDMSFLTKRDLDSSISTCLSFLTSCWRFSLNFLKLRRKTVQHCSAWWACVFRMSVSPSGPTLWENYALMIRTSQKKTSTSESRITLRQLPGSKTSATN